MAEDKKITQPKADKKKKAKDFKGMDLSEAKLELQKVVLLVRTGEETDTSKVKKIKKHIARLKTQSSK